LIELEQTAEAIVTLDATSVCWWGNRQREEQLIAFALVRAFEMIMLDEFSDCSAQRSFTKENQLR
jgi:hypothetical protein